jgi:hypothetical protein
VDAGRVAVLEADRPALNCQVRGRPKGSSQGGQARRRATATNPAGAWPPQGWRGRYGAGTQPSCAPAIRGTPGSGPKDA